MIKKLILSPVETTLKALLKSVGYPLAASVARALRVALYSTVVGAVGWALVNYTSLHLEPVYGFALVTVLMGVDKYLREHKAELTGDGEAG